MASFMHSLVFFLICGLICSVVVPSTADFLTDEFQKWMKEHGVKYNSKAEELKRFAVFKANYLFVEASNHNPQVGFTLGLNKYADLTNDEFLAKLTGYTPLSTRQTSTSFRYGDATVPSSIDWRLLGAVTNVKDQGQCGEYSTIYSSVLQLVQIYIDIYTCVCIIIQYIYCFKTLYMHFQVMWSFSFS